MRDLLCSTGKQGFIIFVALILNQDLKIVCGVFTEPVNVYTIEGLYSFLNYLPAMQE